MMDQWIETLVERAIEAGLIDEQDRIYCRNRVLARLQKLDFTEPKRLSPDAIPDVLERLTDHAVEVGLIEDLLEERDRLAADIMDAFVSKPSEVAQRFETLRAKDVTEATDFFYQMSRASNYIQTKRIANNITYAARPVTGRSTSPSICQNRKKTHGKSRVPCPIRHRRRIIRKGSSPSRT